MVEAATKLYFQRGRHQFCQSAQAFGEGEEPSDSEKMVRFPEVTDPQCHRELRLHCYQVSDERTIDKYVLGEICRISDCRNPFGTNAPS